MSQNKNTYAVESVTSGHPDKICDQISDALLDAYLAQDPESRVALETFGGHGLLVIAGEVTSNAIVDASAIARDVYKNIGYDDNLEIIERIIVQSPDIALGVDSDGAGDQGIMYGYATNETQEYLPLGNVLIHKLTRGLEELRKQKVLPWLKPDGKAQVTVRDGKVVNVLVSTQHDEAVDQETIREELIEKLIKPVIGDLEGVEVFINPTGRFVLGGFAADTGLTGRKLMVDTYGGLYPHGGGAFSGKDATKVDRSAAYMARFAAKNIVASGHAKEAIVSVAYAIGRADPLMVSAHDEQGRDITHLLSDYDFRPQEIIKRLGLKRPIFRASATYGHFGKNDSPWEEVVEAKTNA